MTGARAKTRWPPATRDPSLFTLPKLPASFGGGGAVWTKIFESDLREYLHPGYHCPLILKSVVVNPNTNQWASDVVGSSGGKHSVTISCSLLAGEYLVREFGPGLLQGSLGD